MAIVTESIINIKEVDRMKIKDGFILRQVAGSYIVIAVGDDWQSIYAYAGSDITLFTNFKKTFGYGLELCITKTYRNAQEVIDIAGGFVQKNSSQIRLRRWQL